MSGPPGPPAGHPPMGMRPPGPPPGLPGPPGLRPSNGAFGQPPTFGMTGMGMPNFPPPLPAGWSEHTAPDGFTKYFYNSDTKQSTYVRPSFAPLPSFPPPIPGSIIGAGVPREAPAEKKEKKKKEKPKEKVPIPGTDWTRITTTEGNIFYFHKEDKRSEWTVPEEIKGEVEALEREEQEKREEEAREKKRIEEEERLARLRERERVRLEVEEERRNKRKEREGEATNYANAAANSNGGGDIGRETKITKTDIESKEQPKGPEDGDDGDKYGPEDEQDEAAWMREVAAEFAAADAAAIQDEEDEQERNKIAEAEAAKQVFAVPDKVNMSLEEGRALFKALLMEKNINPFMPWDQSLPLFINDPRYILLGSIKDRQEVYDEYCRDIGRARRLNKASTSTTANGSSTSADAGKKSDPEREYKALMREDVTSTRSRWDDFRKKWKKDRRFYNFGRDDREREKAFKVHLRELGERKRADAQRAEQDFFELLREGPELHSNSVWAEVKKSIAKDARYDAVGSSSLREELFKTYISKLASSSAPKETPEEAAERKLKDRKAKEEASLRERQAKVRDEQEKVAREASKSRAGAGKEEAERLFGSLLVDQVRDHEMTWNDAARFLENDPRFKHPSLYPNDRIRLFAEHINRLASKRSNSLHQLFATHAPSLNTPYEEVYPKIVDDPLVKRLGLEGQGLEDKFNAWRRGKEAEARQDFDTMLGENAFVEFWGQMRKKRLDEEASKVKEDEMDEGEGMGEGGAADLTALAQQIDLEEIKSVLKRDGRYRQFDHIPDLREKWLRDYLENQEAASGSRTIHSVGSALLR